MELRRPQIASLLACGAALATAAALPAAAGAVTPVPGCDSFASQADAQDYFGELGGGPRDRVGRLDDDRDGVACEDLGAPYKGYATIGYNLRQSFFFGTVSMPPDPNGKEPYACLYGNRHFAGGPRVLTVFEARPGPDRVVRAGVSPEVRAESGRLIWRADKEEVPRGSYYVSFEARAPLTPYGRNPCPGFRSREVRLPLPPRRR